MWYFSRCEGGYYVVCNYYPADNYFGEYIKSVFPREDSGDVVEEVVEDPKKDLEQFRNMH